MPENVNTSALVIDGANQEDANDNREIMIKIDHVSMVFNMASEQLNNLKEYAIKLAKRELFFEGFKALDDISFEVKKGDVFGIMGTNGSGKSTLLKIVAGVLEPSEGTCEINGSIAPLIELGAGFDMDLTARENIYLNGALLGYSKKFIDEHFDEIVDFAEVEKFLDMPLKNYSSGMVARIAFAIATVIVPEILIVDEVLSVGDFMFQKKCEDRINQLIEEHGVTVLIVSHSNEQIARLCNKAIWIEKGHTRLIGDAEEVCRVYGGLGGRTGSSEAEKQVLATLTSSKGSTYGRFNRVVSGENPEALSVNLAYSGWDIKELESMVLALDNNHINAIVANSVAGALGCPVLPVKESHLSGSIEIILNEIKPHDIYVFDCGSKSIALKEHITTKEWLPTVHFFQSERIYDFSLEVFKYGLDHGLWGEEVGLTTFDNCLESFAIAPFFYRNNIPFIVVGASEVDWQSLKMLFKNFGIKKAWIIGSKENERLSEGIQGFIPCESLCASNVQDTCRIISKRVFEELKARREMDSQKMKVCLSSLSVSWWPEYITYGGFAAKNNAPIYFVDNTNFDEMNSCMKFIEGRRSLISQLIFAGGKGLISESEQQMYCSVLAEGKNK